MNSFIYHMIKVISRCYQNFIEFKKIKTNWIKKITEEMKSIILFAIFSWASALAILEPSLDNEWNQYKISFIKAYESKNVESSR